ncbi:MAG TPA: TonB-dependent receptor [Terriglobales bacterium]|nr:TonB-dependent receptor [Terriglobales bacterium]
MKHLRPRIAMCVGLMLVLLGSASLLAQSFEATVVGSVMDATGAAIPGATITITEDATGRTQTVNSQTNGSYTILQLRPSVYTLKVEANGFKAYTQKQLVLETNQTARIEVKLQVGATTEEVTVTAEAPVVNTDTSRKGEVITNKQVDYLPLNGRNFTDLTMLVGGVYPRPSDDDQGEGVATAGTRTDSTNFILDGVTNRSDRNGSVGVNTSIDSIQEFNVSTSTYSAEYGKTAGAQINVVSKSGTNEYHGTLFEYLRNDAFDAQNYFGGTSDLKRNQFGGTLGGRIIRDRTFFFASYEGTRERRSASQILTAPSADWLGLGTSGIIGDFRNVRGAGKDGILGNTDDTNKVGYSYYDTTAKKVVWSEFPTLNVIPASMLSPIALQLVPYFPAANFPERGIQGYLADGKLRKDRNQFLGKIDHRLSNSNNLFVRWARQSGTGYDPFPSSRNFYPGFGRDTRQRYDSLAVNDTHMISPSVVNEFRFGWYGQHNGNFGQNRSADYNAIFGIPGVSPDPEYQGFPAIRVDGYSEMGDRPNDPYAYKINNYQFTDNLSVVKGKHSLKFGLDLTRVNYVEADVRNIRGDFRFRGRYSNPKLSTSTGMYSFADFLMGVLDSTQRQVGATPTDLRGWQYAGFVQDDWRVNSRLTLNLGLRYEYQAPLVEATGRLANFIPDLGRVVDSTERLYGRSLIYGDKNNWSPRIGFAYRPFNDDRTVIRGGGGLFYSLETFNVIRQQIAVNYPYVVREQYSRDSRNPTALTLATPFPSGRGGVAVQPYGADPHGKTPDIYQYNLTLERELIRDLTLEMGYIGSQGRHLGRRYDVNQAVPTGEVTSTTNNNVTTYTPVTVRPWAQYSTIQYQDQMSTSNYNAFQATLRRRSRNGLTMLASYTFSRSLDDASSTNNSTTGTQKYPQDIYNWAPERALSDFHRAHQFTASANYELPFGRNRAFLSDASGVLNAIVGGWQVNSIIAAYSGRPFTPQFSAADVSSQRPDLVGDPWNNIPEGYFYNPSAFARPVVTPDHPYFYGNLPRNTMIGPKYFMFDMGMSKTFRLTERTKLQFRAETFNIVNHPNFELPVFQIDNTLAGQLNDTVGTNREFQFALKLMF